MTTGNIQVEAENIFPIIKKFLYSDHDIFLRELISNAVDATQKMKTLTSIGTAKTELGDLTIEVKIDEKNKTLHIIDKGIGMTEKEVEKYITQIAFSGAEEFVKKYRNKGDTKGIIGHFGLGFYSAFMVADKVEIFSKSYKQGKAVHWTCEGSTNYEIENCDKKERGTEIVLHISDDSKEFLSEARIDNLLEKYCKFMPVEIKFGTKKEQQKTGEKDKDGKEITKEVEVDNIINNPEPAWTKSPQSLKDEDYKSFYHELYPMSFEEPLFHIHLNVDYPFNLTGILYFPKIKERVGVQQNKIQLYCNQVFVTDSVEGIVPEFLTLLHGVLDSPDIPLNVSRSYLQSDQNVKKISGHITKKVADKLAELFKTDRKDFETKWEYLRLFVEYGMLSNEKFYEKAKDFALYKDLEGNYFTFDEYKNKIEKSQTNKDKKIVFLYSNDVEAQHSYVEAAKEKGYDVLIMNTPLSAHLAGKLEQENENISFKRVDADIIEKLIEKDEETTSKLTDDEKEKIKPIFEKIVEKGKFMVSIENMSEKEAPVIITQPEFSRRMKDMQAIGGGGGFYGAMPEMYNLVINANHPLISKILKAEKGDVKENQAKQAIDLALLSQGMLKGKELTDFINRSINLIN